MQIPHQEESRKKIREKQPKTAITRAATTATTFMQLNRIQVVNGTPHVRTCNSAPFFLSLSPSVCPFLCVQVNPASGNESPVSPKRERRADRQQTRRQLGDDAHVHAHRAVRLNNACKIYTHAHTHTFT